MPPCALITPRGGWHQAAFQTLSPTKNDLITLVEFPYNNTHDLIPFTRYRGRSPFVLSLDHKHVAGRREQRYYGQITRYETGRTFRMEQGLVLARLELTWRRYRGTQQPGGTVTFEDLSPVTPFEEVLGRFTGSIAEWDDTSFLAVELVKNENEPPMLHFTIRDAQRGQLIATLAKEPLHPDFPFSQLVNGHHAIKVARVDDETFICILRDKLSVWRVKNQEATQLFKIQTVEPSNAIDLLGRGNVAWLVSNYRLYRIDLSKRTISWNPEIKLGAFGVYSRLVGVDEAGDAFYVGDNSHLLKVGQTLEAHDLGSFWEVQGISREIILRERLTDKFLGARFERTFIPWPRQ